MNQPWEVVINSKKQKQWQKRIQANKGKKTKSIILLNNAGEQWDSTQLNGLEKNDQSISKLQFKNKINKKNDKEEKNHFNVKRNQQKQQVSTQQKSKTLKQAFRQLSVDDFIVYLKKFKLLHPDSKLSWLKGVADYLNEKLSFDCDPTFSGKSYSYPSCLFPEPFRNNLIEFLHSMGETNLVYFYHYTLLESMVTKMNNNIKVLLQVIGQEWPYICSSNLANTVLLRNSYQNRCNIALSIFWSIGQGGFQNLMEGIKVWQNIMLPCLEMKNYNKYITDYLECVLNTAVNQSFTLNQNEFFSIYNILNTHYSGISRDCQQSLTRSAALLLQKFISNSSKHEYIFLKLFRQIQEGSKNNNELTGCISCLLRSDGCFKVWKMNYKKQIVASTYLLEKIEIELEYGASGITNSTSFCNFLKEAANLNNELLLVKKQDANLNGLIKALESLQEKTLQQHRKKQKVGERKKYVNSSSSCCRWTVGILLLIALITAGIIYDTNVYGKGVFAKSTIGKSLKSAGFLPQVEEAWYITMGAAARGYKWTEKNVAPCLKIFGSLLNDLMKILCIACSNIYNSTCEFVNAKLPQAAQFLDYYVPGLPNTVQTISNTLKNSFLSFADKVVVFFKTQVLVGRFSSENLRKTLNQTQHIAINIFNQFHEKVDAYSKLK